VEEVPRWIGHLIAKRGSGQLLEKAPFLLCSRKEKGLVSRKWYSREAKLFIPKATLKEENISPGKRNFEKGSGLTYAGLSPSGWENRRAMGSKKKKTAEQRSCSAGGGGAGQIGGKEGAAVTKNGAPREIDCGRGRRVAAGKGGCRKRSRPIHGPAQISGRNCSSD